MIKRLETKIASAKTKTFNSNKQKDNSQILEDIINSHKSHLDKSGIDFNSTTVENIAETKTKCYINSLKDSLGQETPPRKNDSATTWRLPTNKRTIADSGYMHKLQDDRND